jgi:hypothetical protein
LGMEVPYWLKNVELINSVDSYWLDDRGSDPGMGCDFFLHYVHTSSGTHPVSYRTDIGGSFLGHPAAGAWRLRFVSI